MRVSILVLLLSLVAVRPAAAQLPGTVIVETIELNDGDQRLAATIESIKTQIDNKLVDYRAIRLGKLTNVVDGAFVTLIDSPIWRLDLRRLVELEPTSPNPFPFASWFPIPDLNPLNNIPLSSGHSAAWIDVREYPDVTLDISITERRRMRLEWRNLPVERWHALEDGRIDVVVLLGFEKGKPGISGSIDVRLRTGTTGKIDVLLASVSFPELLLDPLNIGAEATGDTQDDVLLSPYQHGFLVPNPIDWLSPTSGLSWGPDSFVTDYAPGLFMGGESRKFTYPGDCATQFLYLYDATIEAAAQEDWVEATGNVITGYRTRPSRRRGTGAGVYVAAHDPDVAVKRMVHEVLDQGQGKQLRLAVRTFVEFTSDRIGELKTPGLGKPGALWQRYAQGPFASTEEFDREDATVAGRDPTFAWPVVIELLAGDWLDAVGRYRDFFVAESRAIRRDLEGNAIRLRDLPASVLPASHRELIGTVELLDVTPAAPPPAGDPVNVARADDVRQYLAWLREDWSEYQSKDESTEAPVYLVTHREGMVSGEVGTMGHAIAPAGNDGADNHVRPLLPDFMLRLREPEPRWLPIGLPIGWPARVLLGLRREHGWLDVNNPIVFPGAVSTHRITGHESLFDTDVWLTSYARASAGMNLTQRIERTLIETRARSVEEETYLTQLDLIELRGPGATATPDYSEWAPDGYSSRQTIRGVGGGNGWFLGHQELRRAMIEDPVLIEKPPAIGFSTEQFNEAVLQRNLPIGARTPFPASVLEDDVERHLSVYAEPVMLTSYLFHDFSLMRGEGVTFAKYFAVPIDEVPVGSGQDPRYFDQTLALERNYGYRLSRHHLARQIVHGGLLSGVGVAAAGQMLFENDAGGDGVLGSVDDRLCLSDGETAGPFDVAKGSWSPMSPPAFARDLLRARSQMRRFFIGGRRVRDPFLADVVEDPDFYADDMFVKRWAALDLSESMATFHGGTDAMTGGMNIERLVVGTYVDDGALDDGRRHRLMICVANPSSKVITYQLLFDPADWDLPKDETYVLEALDLKLDLIQLFGTTPGVKWSSGSLRLPTQVSGADPLIQGYSIQFWVLRKTS